MQPKYASQMMDDLNQIWLDESSGSPYHMSDAYGPLKQQQDRILFLSHSSPPLNCNTTTAAQQLPDVAATTKKIISSSSEKVEVVPEKVPPSSSPPQSPDCSDTELFNMFHRAFCALLQVLQKIIDFDQILRWARALMEKCVINVSAST